MYDMYIYIVYIYNYIYMLQLVSWFHYVVVSNMLLFPDNESALCPSRTLVFCWTENRDEMLPIYSYNGDIS